MFNKRILLVVVLVVGLIANLLYKEYRKNKELRDGLLHIYFFNIGQGDSFLVKTPCGELFLIDGGPNESVLFKLSDVLPFWQNKMGTVLISHFHRDHYAGIYYMQEFFKINTILYPYSYRAEDELRFMFNDFIADEKKEINYYFVSENLSYVFESDVVIEIIRIHNHHRPISENSNSLIVWIKYKDFDAVFTGDAPPPVQKAAQAYLPSGSIELLKVPHQGSKYDFYEPFIEYLQPKNAVISVGKNNYGHPHKEVIEYYQVKNISLYRTDYSKDYIFLKTDGFRSEIAYH